MRKDIKEIRAALQVVRKSEELLIHLQVSISSVSSDDNLIDVTLGNYLSLTKRRLFFLMVKVSMGTVAKMLLKTTFKVLSYMWSRVTGRPRLAGE